MDDNNIIYVTDAFKPSWKQDLRDLLRKYGEVWVRDKMKQWEYNQTVIDVTIRRAKKEMQSEKKA